MLNLSTCILLRTKKQKKARSDLFALVQSPQYIFHKTRDEGNCDQVVRDSQIGHVEGKGAVTSHLHISLLLQRKQDKTFLSGLGWCRAAEIQTVWDDFMRLQNAITLGQCSPAGVTLNLGDHSHL